MRTAQNTSAEIKAKYGQYLTPKKIADFMVSLLSPIKEHSRFLDAGAGVGALTNSFLELALKQGVHNLSINLFEIQSNLLPYLTQLFEYYHQYLVVQANLFNEDYVTSHNKLQVDFAVINPPYFKISAKSETKVFIKKNFGIDIPNIYAAFLVKTISNLAPEGELVAIIPRSFCNGVYFKDFRQFVLAHTNIEHIHTFISRNKIFKDDEVLQENIIIKLKKTAEPQLKVTISESLHDDFSQLSYSVLEAKSVILEKDINKFIRLPTSGINNPLDIGKNLITLEKLGINVSTGAIVDFRTTEHLVQDETGDVPLIYPQHFNRGLVSWPLDNFKKYNSIKDDISLAASFYETGNYCMVKRFSAKEEHRRITTAVVTPDMIKPAKKIAFENHLNVFHNKKRGLEKNLAYGLSAYLSCSYIDDYFRRFSGHTQVNVSDLKSLPYLSYDNLCKLGHFAQSHTKEQIEHKIQELIIGNEC